MAGRYLKLIVREHDEELIDSKFESSSDSTSDTESDQLNSSDNSINTGLSNGMAAVTRVDIEELLQSKKAKKLGSIQPGTFSGKADENAKNFVDHFECYAKLTGLNDENKCLTFGLLLKGIAACWFNGLEADTKKDFNLLREHFKDTYLSKSKNWINMQHLEDRKLQVGERVEQYVTDVIKMTNKLGPSEAETKQYMIRGLSNKLRAELITHNPSTLADTIERVYLSEAALKLKSTEVQSIDVTHQLAAKGTAISQLDKRIDDMSYNHTTIQSLQQTHEQQTIPSQFNNSTSRRPNTCFVCEKRGHMANDCWHRQNQRQQTQNGGPRPNWSGRSRQQFRQREEQVQPQYFQTQHTPPQNLQMQPQPYQTQYPTPQQIPPQQYQAQYSPPQHQQMQPNQMQHPTPQQFQTQQYKMQYSPPQHQQMQPNQVQHPAPQHLQMEPQPYQTQHPTPQQLQMNRFPSTDRPKNYQNPRAHHVQ